MRLDPKDLNRKGPSNLTCVRFTFALALVLYLPLIRQSMNMNLAAGGKNSVVSDLEELIVAPAVKAAKNGFFSVLKPYHSHLFRKGNESSIANLKSPYKLDANQQQIVNALENLNIRFYVYDHPDIKNPDFWNESYYYNGIERQEIEFIQAFLDHPWRTNNSDEASFFIVPLPLIASRRRHLVAMMNRLPYDPVYAKHPQGDRHILFAIEGRILEEISGWPQGKALIRRIGRTFAKGTMVKKFDIFNCIRMSRDNQDHGDWNELWKTMLPYYQHSIGPGLLVATDLPLITPMTYSQFEAKTNYLFYHTRTAPSVYGSTKYRKAPLAVADQFPFNVSIGYDMPYDEWKSLFMGSRFCLGIRGDDPATSSVSRAVKVGCIPIIASNYLPRYAPSFPHLLDQRHFAFFVDENEFLNDPLSTVTDIVQKTPRSVVQEKMANLTFAQRLLFPEHPQSLFIPAMLYEAELGYSGPYKVPQLPRTHVKY